MRFFCQPSTLRGEVPIPGSKSHTIRALAIAALANGDSLLEKPLRAHDTWSAVNALRALGADIDTDAENWVVHGFGSMPKPRQGKLDLGNSGTSLNILMALAALLPSEQSVVFTGDSQLQRRPAGPLMQSLRDLGARAQAHYDNDCPPLTIGGRLSGGRTVLEARTSQYLTSLLIACPLAAGDSEIKVPLLYEAAYATMTLDWLKSQCINVEYTPQMDLFQIPGRQAYQPFQRRIPADFSSATFFLAAGAMPGNRVVCQGLDMNDSQGDKAVVEFLRAMGARVETTGSAVEIAGDQLQGIEIDLNDTPDAIPAMAVLACFAKGETRLVNVPQARIKETDRLAVMALELRKLGGDIRELADGLVIRESPLRGGAVHGHGDHRVVMALALAGLGGAGPMAVDTAEAAAVTFPDFMELMQGLGGVIEGGED